MPQSPNSEGGQPPQVFVLSPASCSGQRAKMLFSERATFSLAVRLRLGEGATLGETFSFLSGLYFRGKLTYARAFCKAPTMGRGELRRTVITGQGCGLSGIHVITAGRGLLDAETPVSLTDLRSFAEVPIDLDEPKYRQPLERDVVRLAEELGPIGRAVLLGSIATDKYVEILAATFGERLVFPSAFVGRGDMSRGGLMLRAVDEGQELAYVPALGALRRGKRPARLTKRN